MTLSVNKTFLGGNVGEVKHGAFADGTVHANVSLATTERWKDKETGEPREATEWHNLVFRGKLAELVRDHVTKGREIYVEGKTKTREYTAKDSTVKQRISEVHVNELQFAGKKPSEE